MAPDSLSISYFTGWAPSGTSTIALRSQGGFWPTGILLMSTAFSFWSRLAGSGRLVPAGLPPDPRAPLFWPGGGPASLRIVNASPPLIHCSRVLSHKREHHVKQIIGRALHLTHPSPVHRSPASPAARPHPAR